ncbi:ParB/RepB/Spo0J family partition protein [Jeotgalibacillus haloalkalitolerans]|uniref:ParB/RepB/Spo0J family partition protein n=1 Tax=Jeotgalibacillus haloalkalitolerans TaxID=3104292 RepID=A0ABU5KH76_9BACL|nr:ParB/RepB/Spo0J family partition protein [Jeotgalibacillus sp. HH7-29]MDZ5710601.1 ParB/RepB/Spo0J family partition protein [Jeotgalibacillus sp. HH7-29]
MAKGLGKGVNNLFKDMSSIHDEHIQQLSVKDIRPNPYQPRKIFDEIPLEELTLSVKEHGILQPIIVRKSLKGFEIVAGERRFRAAKAAALTHVPAVIRDLNDRQMMELSVLENLQREDLTPVEEAKAYETLMQKLKISQDELAKKVGKSRPHIANHLRLLNLSELIQEKLSRKELSMGHGRALAGLKDKETAEQLADKVLKEGLNVRQLEKLISEAAPTRKEKPKRKADPHLKQQETVLRERFGTSVAIKKNKNKGKIEIEFMSEDDLERILSLLGEDTENRF